MERLRPVADAVTGETVTVFTAEDVDEPMESFGITAAFPLPDGTVLVSWDPNQETAGDDREPFSAPRVDVLSARGTRTPVPPPTVDGVPVGPAFTLLAAGPDGTSYFWDQAGERVLTRSMSGGVVNLGGDCGAPPPDPDASRRARRRPRAAARSVGGGRGRTGRQPVPGGGGTPTSTSSGRTRD